jgi:SAM-dependent methyltransferase
VSESWEDRASQWLGWARTPGHDAYWYYRDAFFDLVPAPRGRTLEVGCGEGRVTRDLLERGHDVVALDASPTLLAAARERDDRAEYVVGDAGALAFGDGAFALVVLYNVLMDVPDMPRAVAGAARVLGAGGRLCLCVTPPVSDASGSIDGRRVVNEDYLAGGTLSIDVDRDGHSMRFDGQRHPIEAYARALEAAGLRIEALREPAPASGAPEHYRPWAGIPMFLMLRAAR